MHVIRPHGIENVSRLRGNSIDLKVFAHDQENIEIVRGRFRRNKTTPNEDSAQLSIGAGEFQERSKAA